MIEESTSLFPGKKQAVYAFFQTTDHVHLRYGHWTSVSRPACGTILFLPGRAEFLEKYEDTFDALTSRGFDVLGLDWRGQGKSDRLLADHNKGYVHDFNDYLSDLVEFIEKVVLPQMTAPLTILAHSMGGHIALRYLTEKAAVPVSKAIVTAPMLAIYTDPLPPKLARLISWAAVACRIGDHISPGLRHNPYKCPWESNRLTSDYSSFQRIMNQVAEEPYLNVGAVTYGWLSAAFRSMDHLSKVFSRHVPDLPILVVMAGQDRIIKNDAVEILVKRLPDCEPVLIEDAKHEIMQERKELREQFWSAFDAFTTQVST